MRKYDTATKRIVSKGINKPPEPADYTELAHIVAESRKTGIRDETQPESTASAWAALEHFGKVKVADDHLNETGPHRYRVCAVHTFYILNLGFQTSKLQIQLTIADSVFPIPDPHLLILHAACAKVANFSGAAEYVDAIFKDMD
ncbi:hypothetical protein BKA93DRAFT_280419 [Sparassis latifolia]